MSTSTEAFTFNIPPRPAGAGNVDLRVVSIAVTLFALGTAYLQATVHWRQAVLFLLGGVFGLLLYHAAFGFTSAWRVFVADRRGAGLRAQMLLLAVACLLFFPIIGSNTPLLTDSIRGNVNPAGVAVMVGAFMFGMGMQLGGGCASGTLFAVGGGNARMIVTLAAFILGSAIGTAHAPWWQSLPALPPVSIVSSLGAWPALLVSFAVFGTIVGITVVVERRHHGRLVASPSSPRTGWKRALQGPWPIVIGAFGLALANFATLALAGRPWGITSAFALWGAKAASVAGVDVGSWAYWSTPGNAAALRASVFEHVTSIMDFGIILGALAAAGLAGRFSLKWSISNRSLAAAVFGGLLLGYGARLAYGCNIGAYFSGVASGSLHGWLWLVAAFLGSMLGVRLRPMCDMPVEKTPLSGVR